MAPSHAVEWIDLKESALCPACSERTAALLPRQKKVRASWF
jgi:predicted Zn-dependent protease